MKGELHDISRRTGVVSGLTLISRVMGLVRDAILAYAFGATHMADAFYVAFRIPNLLRRLVAEGALTIAFIPVFTDYLKLSRSSAKEAASVVFTFLSLLLVGLVVGGILFAPWIVRLIAWGFTDDPVLFDQTVFLTRLLFPYIFLISLVALAMGILNALKHFAAPAASPIILNIGIIIGALVLRHFFALPTVGLALGVLFGGILQLAMQIPPLLKEGMLPRFHVQRRHPALKGLLLLMIPSAFGAAVYQINVMIVTLLASFLPEGSVSYLWYADRIAEFPLGVFGLAVATAALPTLSDHAADNNLQSLKETLNYSLRLTFLITIPSSVGIFLLATPIVSVLFGRGEFQQESVVATAGALACYALKIPFVSGVRNIVPAFFALKDAKSPVYLAGLAVVANSLIALWLMQTMLHLGLALSLSISSAIQFAALIYALRRKIGRLGTRRLFRSLAKTGLATFVMAIVLFAALRWLLPFSLSWPFFTQLSWLAVYIMMSALLFLTIIRLISRDEYDALLGLLSRRLAKTKKES